MYCSNCGKQIDDSAMFCPECGARTANGTQRQSAYTYQQRYYTPYMSHSRKNRQKKSGKNGMNRSIS